ncbi:MAG TPA: aldolase/citrate lyase family protein [Burkholderiales bacterium]|jgi:4-hydroxy-2-oxoheptanedioate aldolase|nr:aldolase/citrate lyase family protein [Burkholderiales bacterium]
MRASNLRTIWAQGGAVINGWCGIPSSIAAENMAQAGWDSLTVDLQHGHIDYQTAVTMLQAISTTSVTPLVRAPWNEPGILMKLLDAGAYGVICPMINTRADCEAFVGACRYPPRGYRSYGPVRAAWYGGGNHLREADGTLATIAMIETKQAIGNLDEILSVPGLDAAYIGPSDLSISYGADPNGGVPNDPVVLQAVGKMLEACRRHGVVPCMHCGSTKMAREMIAMGFRLVTVLYDNYFLQQGATAAVAEVRKKGER